MVEHSRKVKRQRKFFDTECFPASLMHVVQPQAGVRDCHKYPQAGVSNCLKHLSRETDEDA